MGQEGRQRPDRVLLGQLGLWVGDQVRVCGWVQTLRLQRRMQFVVLRDETGAVQLTNRRETRPELDQRIDGLTVGSAVALTGRVVDAPQVKLGGIEVLVDSIDQLSIAEQPLPIAENSHPDLRLDWRFLDLRAPRQHLIFRVGDLFEQRMRSFLLGRGFTELHTPKLMGAASESGAEVFRVDYFGSSAYLAQSPQFYKQMAIAGVRDALGRQIEEVLGVDLVVPPRPFPRVTLAAAREQLSAAGWRPGDPASEDLDGEGERMLSKLVADKLGHQFVFVTDYPVSVRPFYHMRPANDPAVTSSFDLIWNGLEVTTGAQREHRYDVLVTQAAEQGVALGPISRYLDCFRYGCPPHGGLGIGVSRLLMKLWTSPRSGRRRCSSAAPTAWSRDPGALTGSVAGVGERWLNAVLGSARRCWWPAFVCANTST